MIKRAIPHNAIVRIGFAKARVIASSAPGKAPLPQVWSYKVRLIGWAFPEHTDPFPDVGYETWVDDVGLTVLAD
jgi:hypothetical protein